MGVEPLGVIMSRRLFSIMATAVVSVGIVIGGSLPAQATIHPIVQSINCAAAEARAHADIANPVGQTPEGFTTEIVSLDGNLLMIGFPTPLVFDNSDFRALIATGFIDEVVTNAEGEVTALIVDLQSVPMAISGEGGMHCAAA
jgi:hypothetical protein